MVVRLSSLPLAQIVEAEPWTAGSVLAGIVIVLAIVAIVVWRVTRTHD